MQCAEKSVDIAIISIQLFVQVSDRDRQDARSFNAIILLSISILAKNITLAATTINLDLKFQFERLLIGKMACIHYTIIAMSLACSITLIFDELPTRFGRCRNSIKTLALASFIPRLSIIIVIISDIVVGTVITIIASLAVLIYFWIWKKKKKKKKKKKVFAVVPQG